MENDILTFNIVLIWNFLLLSLIFSGKKQENQSGVSQFNNGTRSVKNTNEHMLMLVKDILKSTQIWNIMKSASSLFNLAHF